MQPLLAQIPAFLSDERGATAIEYTMIAGIISITLVAGMTVIGTTVLGYFNGVLAGLRL